VIGVALHYLASEFDDGGSPVSPLNPVADTMGQGVFGHGVIYAMIFAPSPKGRPESVWRG